MSVGSSEKPPVNRAKFATNLGVLAATLGSAVGLGNIWKFPYLTGSNGGAAFLLVYIICMLLIGIPVMVSELTLGRAARSNAIATMQKLSPARQPWWLIGAAGVLAAFLIMAFYSEVAAWVFAYIFKAIQGGILSTDPEVTKSAFNGLVGNPTQSLIWQWIDLAVVGFIILLGVNKGIESATKKLMPILLGLLILVGIRSITLPGAGQGLTFLFQPDFTKLTAASFLIAMGLAFFKLSVGMGTMITYGSYFRDDQDIPGTAFRVAFSDLAVSLLAGIAIFPAVFAFGYQPNAGPSLLFLTIPSVFASMPLGNIFMVIFFILTAIASIGAQISLVEVPVAFLEEKFHLSRQKASIITVLSIVLVGSLAALSNSTLADVKLFGMTFFDLFDYTTSNILLPLGGLFIAIFISWIWGYKKLSAALSNNGQLSNQGIIKVFYGTLLVVTPVLVTIVLLNGLKIIQ
ncbi:sodium-dependent transporter [Leptolinea tardivitalis]|uniref:Transporter n=1 Tax=Leptolinea tardivitalis TaxID=229920 RepID=A0A0P6WNR0_9CHLR|nr:sodium-dependent transporter [Leptolinea tardivitalis]KPL70451.1 transporter [Leptolinea tardivitalis]GAP22036.1 Na+-dependent transporters of the SNF family [Leptolinea tardivitalis]